MTEERFEQFLRDAAQDYHEPPEPPREEMWARIEATRVTRRGRRRAAGGLGPLLRWGVGIAAVLAVGIAIGRMTTPGTPGGGAAPSADRATGEEGSGADDFVFEVAAVDYLERTDAFLSLFMSEARSGRADGEVGDWARELLTTARMMIDSPAGDDPELEGLLQDLELILVQITQYAGAQDESELEIIEQGIDERGVELRLRAKVATAAERRGFLGES